MQGRMVQVMVYLWTLCGSEQECETASHTLVEYSHDGRRSSMNSEWILPVSKAMASTKIINAAFKT